MKLTLIHFIKPNLSKYFNMWSTQKINEILYIICFTQKPSKSSMCFTLTTHLFTTLQVFTWPMWLSDCHIGKYRLTVFPRHKLNCLGLGSRFEVEASNLNLDIDCSQYMETFIWNETQKVFFSCLNMARVCAEQLLNNPKDQCWPVSTVKTLGILLLINKASLLCTCPRKVLN